MSEGGKQRMDDLKNISAALSKAQAVMAGAKKSTRNDFFKTSYANLSSVFEAIREPFAENGLSVSQTMDVLDNGRQVLRTRLFHVSGEFLDSRMLLPEENNPQKLGSLISYYRRYALMAIAGVPAEDDDGNSASTKLATNQVRHAISKEQIIELNELCHGDEKLIGNILKNCAVQSFDQISQGQYTRVRAYIMSWIDR